MSSSHKAGYVKLEELKSNSPLLTTANRLITFKRYGYSRKNEAFSPQFRFSLARAGWYSPESNTSPSCVKCPFCLLEVKFESDDDPWLFHSMNSDGCEFVRIGKLDEDTWTLAETIALATRCAASNFYNEVISLVENVEENQEKSFNSAEVTKQLVEIRDQSIYLTYEHRLASFDQFIHDKNKKALARAGWISTATQHCPNTAKCPFCLIELEFEPNDDPWVEHQNISKNCDFVKLNKLDEKQWSVEEALKLAIRCATLTKYESAIQIGNIIETTRNKNKLEEQLKMLLARSKPESRRATLS